MMLKFQLFYTFGGRGANALEASRDSVQLRIWINIPRRRTWF